MDTLLVVFFVTIAIFPTKTIHIECWICDNEYGVGKCDEHSTKDDVTCTGSACSVTSYVRNTAKGCRSSHRLLLYFIMYVTMYVFMYLFSSKITHKTSSQKDSKAQRHLQLPATKKRLGQILATTHNMTETKHNKNPSLMNSGPERTTLRYQLQQ